MLERDNAGTSNKIVKTFSPAASVYIETVGYGQSKETLYLALYNDIKCSHIKHHLNSSIIQHSFKYFFFIPNNSQNNNIFMNESVLYEWKKYSLCDAKQYIRKRIYIYRYVCYIIHHRKWAEHYISLYIVVIMQKWMKFN